MTVARLGLAASGWLALLATMLPEASPVRVAVVTAFLLVCPGLAAFLALAPRRAPRGRPPAEALEAALLSLVLGLSLATLVTVALFFGGVFTATRCLLVLAVLTSVLTLATFLNGRPGARNRDKGVHAG
ncbi:hypothetical protein ACFTWD_22305 [Streptomyces sp. NPDC056943]|uniref:hypothetical protein n=1 Tax=Streptomyces sp. NPDC056943 TaxID=3345971 RepID=UPI0036279959